MLTNPYYKHNIIVVPKLKQYHPNINFSAILTYCKVKESFKDPNPFHAMLHLQQISGYITTCQISHYYFLGLFLCSLQLFLILFACGNTPYSKPINANKNPYLFIKTILTMSFGISCYLGFDVNLKLASGVYKISLKDFKKNSDQPNVYWLKFLSQAYYWSICWRRRGTKVLLCRASIVFCVLKDTCL